MRTAIILTIFAYPAFLVYVWFFYQSEKLVTYTLHFHNRKEQLTVYRDSKVEAGGLYVRKSNNAIIYNIRAYKK